MFSHTQRAIVEEKFRPVFSKSLHELFVYAFSDVLSNLQKSFDSSLLQISRKSLASGHKGCILTSRLCKNRDSSWPVRSNPMIQLPNG